MTEPDSLGDADLVIEFPAAGLTYSHDEFGVYAYDTYPEWSVNAGRERRRALGTYAALAEAQSAFPAAAWDGPGTGFVPQPEPSLPPAWLDPAAAGESWDGN